MNDRISNADARRLFLYLHGLSDLKDRKYEDYHLPHMINKIGFVQIDSIKTVERAHHHILFSRLKSYERTWLKKVHPCVATRFAKIGVSSFVICQG